MSLPPVMLAALGLLLVGAHAAHAGPSPPLGALRELDRDIGSGYASQLFVAGAVSMARDISALQCPTAVTPRAISVALDTTRGGQPLYPDAMEVMEAIFRAGLALGCTIHPASPVPVLRQNHVWLRRPRLPTCDGQNPP